MTRLVQLAPVAPRWVPWADSLGADRARRTDSTTLKLLQVREKRGDFRGDPVGHCRARAAVYTPATFGDPSRVGFAPDLCRYPTEWPELIGAYFGALIKSIEGFDWTDSLSRVAEIPRLVIHGAEDNTPLAGNGSG